MSASGKKQSGAETGNDCLFFLAGSCVDSPESPSSRSNERWSIQDTNLKVATGTPYTEITDRLLTQAARVDLDKVTLQGLDKIENIKKGGDTSDTHPQPTVHNLRIDKRERPIARLRRRNGQRRTTVAHELLALHSCAPNATRERGAAGVGI